MYPPSVNAVGDEPLRLLPGSQVRAPRVVLERIAFEHADPLGEVRLIAQQIRGGEDPERTSLCSAG
jgi:hypothetical protein